MPCPNTRLPEGGTLWLKLAALCTPSNPQEAGALLQLRVLWLQACIV